jgi:hypothetical protein
MNVRPGQEFEATVSNAPTGLEGTIGFQILDNRGAAWTPRFTAGIHEYPAGSGFYYAILIAPTVAGQYTILWDTGTISPTTIASDDLVVGPTPSNLPGTFGQMRSDIDNMAGLALTDEERDRLLNEGNLELTTQSEWLRPTLNLGPTTAGVSRYALPDNFWTVKKVVVAGRPFDNATEETVERVTGSGELALNTDGLYWIDYDDIGEEQLALYPTPSANSTLVLRYVARPPLLTEDEDEPVVPKRRGIVDYAMAIALGVDEDNADLRAYYKSQFDIAVAELKRLRRMRSGGGVRVMRIAGVTA